MWDGSTGRKLVLLGWSRVKEGKRTCDPDSVTHGHQNDLDTEVMFAGSGPIVACTALYDSHMHPSRQKNTVKGRVRNRITPLVIRASVRRCEPNA